MNMNLRGRPTTYKLIVNVGEWNDEVGRVDSKYFTIDMPQEMIDYLEVPTAGTAYRAVAMEIEWDWDWQEDSD
jgi:hypothetical protein